MDKNKLRFEYLFSLIYVLLYGVLLFASGKYEVVFFVIASIIFVMAVVIAIPFIKKDKSLEEKHKSFSKLLISHILVLVILFLLTPLFVGLTCDSGLCGIAEFGAFLLLLIAEVIILIIFFIGFKLKK